MKNIAEELKKILAIKATAEDIKFIEETGFSVKKPTKQTLLLAALYKKAASGDLAAFKVVCELSDKSNGVKFNPITIIDDV